VELLANLLHKIKISKSIIKKTSPERVITLGKKNAWKVSVEKICKNKKISYKRINNKSLSKNSDNLDSGTLFSSKFVQDPLTIKMYPHLVKLRNKIMGYLSTDDVDGSDYDLIIYMQNFKWFNLISPLIELISTSRSYNLLIITPDSCQLPSRLPSRIPHNTLTAYRNRIVQNKINTEYSYAISKFEQLQKQIDFSSAGKIEGLDLRDIVCNWVYQLVIKSHVSIGYYNTMNRVIDIHDPVCLVMPHHSQNFVKSFTESFHNKDKKVVNIATGYPKVTSEISTFSGDKLLAPGRSTKELFESFGVSSEKIEITGQPAFNHLLDKCGANDLISSKVRKKYDVNTDNKICVYLTQTLGGNFDESDRINEAEVVFQTFSTISNVHLLVKLHPTENNTGIYKKIAKQQGLSDFSVVRKNLNNVLIAGDVCLLKDSTTGFDALVAGNDLVVLNTHGSSMNNNLYINSGITDPAIDQASLKGQVESLIYNTPSSNQCLSNQSRQVIEFLNYHYYKLGVNTEVNMKKEIDEYII
jgi:hypothetical protein